MIRKIVGIILILKISSMLSNNFQVLVGLQVSCVNQCTSRCPTLIFCYSSIYTTISTIFSYLQSSFQKNSIFLSSTSRLGVFKSFLNVNVEVIVLNITSIELTVPQCGVNCLVPWRLLSGSSRLLFEIKLGMHCTK